MQRVSIRTLTLLLVLLAAVISFQYIAKARSARADAVWVAGGCPPVTPPSCADACITMDS